MTALQKLIERSKRDREDWRYTDLEALLMRPVETPLPLAGRGWGGGLSASDLLDGRPPHPFSPAREGRGSPAASLAPDSSCLVFVNGVFQTKQSRFGAVPSCILMGDYETGYRLALGEHTCLIAQPIEAVFITDEKAPKEINLKLSIEIGDSGRLTLLERHMPSSAVTVVETSIDLHTRAKFVHGKIVSGGAHLATVVAEIAGGAFYNNFTLIRGGSPVRNEIEARLQGEEAQATLNGAMMLRESEHADTTTRIIHNAPHCASRQIYKTVLADKSRGVFQGKIFVAEGAQKTDGYQLSRALLLSDQAEMDAKPELEIYADDVKCSHGSAIGDLDADALFYLRARGLNENQARALLISAFIGELFDDIPVESWRAIFHAEMEGWQL